MAGLTLDLDITVIVVLGLLLVPFLILNGLVFGPFMRLFEERHERLTGALDRAERQLQEASQKAKDFEDKIAAAAARGAELRNKIRAEAQADMAAKVEVERKRVAGVLAGELDRLRAETSRALQQVEGDARRLAELTAAKLLGRGL